MASFHGTQLSAAMLTDPQALKKHLTNGTPISSHLQASSLSVRQGSEPARSETSLEMPIVPEIALQHTKDDAYCDLRNKGQKAMSSQRMMRAGQVASSTFSPRHLLDPKGLNLDQRRDTKSDINESNKHTQQLDGNPPPSSKELSEIDVNALQKRDREDFEGQGMGSLIERVHNVSQREERPQKKPKVQKDELDVEESQNSKFCGGGKSGEIGDFLKEKKKQGIAETGPVNAVVDLTGGTHLLCSHCLLGH